MVLVQDQEQRRPDEYFADCCVRDHSNQSRRAPLALDRANKSRGDRLVAHARSVPHISAKPVIESIPSCAGHGWNRLTCQQRLWPRLAHEKAENAFLRCRVYHARAWRASIALKSRPSLRKRPPLAFCAEMSRPSCFGRSGLLQTTAAKLF
jgi:hypothetical protein